MGFYICPQCLSRDFHLKMPAKKLLQVYERDAVTWSFNQAGDQPRKMCPSWGEATGFLIRLLVSFNKHVVNLILSLITSKLRSSIKQASFTT